MSDYIQLVFFSSSFSDTPILSCLCSMFSVSTSFYIYMSQVTFTIPHSGILSHLKIRNIDDKYLLKLPDQYRVVTTVLFETKFNNK